MVAADGQNMFFLSMICFMQFPNELLPSDEAFSTVRIEKPAAWRKLKRNIALFSNRLNGLSISTTLERPRRLTKDQFLYRSCYPTDKPPFNPTPTRAEQKRFQFQLTPIIRPKIKIFARHSKIA